MSDYIPGNDGNRIPFIKNYMNILKEEGEKLGLSKDEVANAQAQFQDTLDKTDKAIIDNAAAKKSNGEKKTSMDDSLKLIRRLSNRMKDSPNWTDSHGKSMRTRKAKTQVDLENYKPKFKLKIVANNLEVHFTKLGIDGVNVNVKAGNEMAFTLSGPALRSPYIIKRPPTKPGEPELIAVQLMAFKNGKELGQPSDVATIAFGG